MSVKRQVVMLALLALVAGGCKAAAPSPPPAAADAGSDQSVFKGGAVELDGRASKAGRGPLAFRWRQVAGPPVALLGDRMATPSFTAPRQTTILQFELVVSDDGGASAPDQVLVEVNNRAPVAVAGPDLVVATGEILTLDAGGSSDPDGDPITATWYQRSGAPVTLAAHPDGTATFTAPGSPAELFFSVSVSDGELGSLEETVRVQVVDPSANWPPMAMAGVDQSVPRRSVVLLSGSALDREADPLTWTWTQIAGPTVALLDADRPTASFVAPSVEADLEFQLVVADRLSNGADRVLVLVRNQAPVIQAFALAPAAPVTTSQLTATATVTDVDQDPLTLTWTWRRNGTLLPEVTGPSLDPALTTKGDLILVRLTASDGTLEAFQEASVTVQDSPPVLAVSGPGTATWGQPVAVTVTYSDPDGDPLGDVVLRYGPAGMTVSPAGQVAWTPTLPMFDEQLVVHFGLGVAGSQAPVADQAITVTAPGRPAMLRRSGIGIPFKPSGLVAADLDGDGRTELLVASRVGLFELAYAGGGYAQRWVYPFTAAAGDLTAVAAADVSGDGLPEIFFSTVGSSGAPDGVVVKLDGATRRETARTSLACSDLKVADLDRDGALELVCLSRIGSYYTTDGKVVVLDAATLAFKWETGTISVGSNLAVGNVDADPALEIVTAGGYVFDGATGANQWASATPFGALVAVGDLDGDGVAEIVGMDEWSRFRGFSAVLKAPLWERATSDNDAVMVADLDGDGVSEIVIGDGQWGNVTSYRYRPATNDLVVIDQVNSQDHGVTAIALGDFDGDGKPELAWGSGATSSGADVFVIAGWNPTLGVEWATLGADQLDGPFVGGKLARTAAGQPPGLVFEVPSTASGYGGARIVRLDPASGALALSPVVGSNWSGNAGLDAFDHDGDGVDEVFISTASLYDGYLTAWDFAAGAATWSSPAPSLSVRALAHGELTGDGIPDLVAITTGGLVEIFDVANATVAWTSTSLGAGGDVELADLDGDGLLEIVALAGNRLVTFHRATGAIPWVETASVAIAGSDLAVGDCDGDGLPEIYVLGLSSVSSFDGALAPRHAFAFTGTALSLFIEELGPGRRNLLLAKGDPYASSGTTSTLEAVDAATGARIWISPGLFGSVTFNSLGYVLLGGATTPELAFGTDRSIYLTR
jgi:hypothetical protein